LGFGLVSYAGFTITFQSTVDQIGVPILAFTFGTGYLHENKQRTYSRTVRVPRVTRAFGLTLRTYHTLDTTHTPFVNLNSQIGTEYTTCC